MPVIGCECETCRSTDYRDKRLRTSVLIKIGDKNIVIDTGPDFRQQMLREQINSLDAVLLTHEHNDHVIGIDDVRPFNFKFWRDMPVYGSKRVLDDLRDRFSYIFAENKYPGTPMLALREISENEKIEVEGIEIQPIGIMHGALPIHGFRIEDFTYMTDTKTISEEEAEKTKGSKVLVINALHHDEHHSHLNLKEALEMVERLQPERAYFIHMSHRMGLHAEIDAQLPVNVSLAFDGLKIVVE